MCGIVGLFYKSPELEPRLGGHLAAMLEQMSDRGPDSSGVAVYRDPAPSGSSKLTLYSFDPEMSWDALCGELAATFGGAHEAGIRANHAVIVVEAEAGEVEEWIRGRRPDLRVMSAGRAIAWSTASVRCRATRAPWRYRASSTRSARAPSSTTAC